MEDWGALPVVWSGGLLVLVMLVVISEGKAAEKHPEYPDGNLPELEAPEKERRARAGTP